MGALKARCKQVFMQGAALVHKTCRGPRGTTVNPNFINLFPVKWEVLPEEERERRLENVEALRSNTPKFSLETEFGTIDYVRVGKKGGKVLLLIPGVPDQVFTFHRLIHELADEFDILAFSPPGKGYSTYSERFDFSLDTYAHFWRMIVHIFDLRAVTVLAHSFGLAEMMHAILQYGAEDMRLEGLVSVCGWSPALLAEPLPASLPGLVLGSTEGPALYRRFYTSRWVGIEASFQRRMHRAASPAALAELTREYLRSWPKRDPKTLAFDEKKIRGICATVWQENQLSDRAKSYHHRQRRNSHQLQNLPMLIVGASHDVALRGPRDNSTVGQGGTEIGCADSGGRTYAHRLFEAVKERTSAAGLHRFVVIPETGHLLPLEAGRELAAEVSAFITGRRPARDPAPIFGFDPTTISRPAAASYAAFLAG